MYKADINNKIYEISWSEDLKNFELNGKSYSADIQQIAPNAFHLIKDNKSYQIFVSNIDVPNKKVSLVINNQQIELSLTDELDELLSKMGIDKQAEKKVTELKAPMPGLVKSILVKAGDTVEKGSNLLVLEAMKMENNLKSPDTVVVKKICVESGKAVEKNDTLIIFE